VAFLFSAARNGVAEICAGSSEVKKKSLALSRKTANFATPYTATLLSAGEAVNENDATDLVTALFDRWYMSLVRYALRTTENYDLAEDLAQDTFMQLYQALRAGKSIEHPKAWTICVLRRAMNRQMKDRVPHEPLDELQLVGEPMAPVSSIADIRSLLSVLSPREEEVLLLRLEALKYREIAEQLGISMNSVNTLLARALRKLEEATAQRANKEKVKRHADKQITRAS
jgi:RNA polymerase sigma factor (sigma-70 family)